MSHDDCVAIIGLGYVGLPLAVAFGRGRTTIGFDLNAQRVRELHEGHDRNSETTPQDLAAAALLSFSHDEADLARADVFIITVPTPVDEAKRPDLSFVLSACRTIGRALKSRAAVRGTASKPTVVLESTVYPGCTELVCAPALAASSGLRPGIDFRLGYSPERINPGDSLHTLETVVKVIGANDEETRNLLVDLYSQVAKRGVHCAPSIQVAEAAKVIENTQRDVNIALMNEFASLFERLGITTGDVLAAASTKWNFLPFRPGLVGGHCVPEDPYYLKHRAEEVGYHMQLLASARRINDSVPRQVAVRVVKQIALRGEPLLGTTVLVLGLTFKPDLRDFRNSRAVNVVRELQAYGLRVVVHDPYLRSAPATVRGLGPAAGDADKPTVSEPAAGIVICAAHREYREMSRADLESILATPEKPRVVFDCSGQVVPIELPNTRWMTL